MLWPKNGQKNGEHDENNDTQNQKYSPIYSTESKCVCVQCPLCKIVPETGRTHSIFFLRSANDSKYNAQPHIMSYWKRIPN